MNINETCRKVAPSDRDSLVYTETNKTKQYHQKPACSNLPIPKQKKIDIYRKIELIDTKITIWNQFTSKEDIGKSS